MPKSILRAIVVLLLLAIGFGGGIVFAKSGKCCGRPDAPACCLKK